MKVEKKLLGFLLFVGIVISVVVAWYCLKPSPSYVEFRDLVFNPNKYLDEKIVTEAWVGDTGQYDFSMLFIMIPMTSCSGEMCYTYFIFVPIADYNYYYGLYLDDNLNHFGIIAKFPAKRQDIIGEKVKVTGTLKKETFKTRSGLKFETYILEVDSYEVRRNER